MIFLVAGSTLMVARPIHEIDHAIRRMGGGEFGGEVMVSGPEDLRYLGRQLDWLRRRMIELDEQRVKFLQHVSHELKTPLTALREGPGASFKDERRALELLDPMVRELRTAYTPLRGFASVVHALLREQNRIGSNAQALKEKLDALKSLEKSLAERERTAPGVGR